MAVQTITYDNKSYINQNPDISNINKITDTDMNEIKSVVNNNATELENASTLLNTLLITQTQSISVGNLSGGGEKYDQTTNITIPTGYTPIGIVGYSLTGGNYTRAFLSKLNINSNKDKILWSIRNSSSDSLTNISLSLTLLFIKNSN